MQLKYELSYKMDKLDLFFDGVSISAMCYLIIYNRISGNGLLVCRRADSRVKICSILR